MSKKKRVSTKKRSTKQKSVKKNDSQKKTTHETKRPVQAVKKSALSPWKCALSIAASVIIVFVLIGLIFGGNKQDITSSTSVGTSLGSSTASAGNYNIPAEVVAKNIEMMDDDAVLGDPNAPITIIEFSDFECPYCGRAANDAVAKIKTNYVKSGKVKIVFRDFPLGFHQYAEKAAEAAECAGDQGKYWEMHDKLFSNQGALSVSDLKGYAKSLGLDTATFDSCLDSGKNAAEIAKDMADGQKYGVSGTPAFFINGNSIVGAQPYENFKSIIDAILEGKDVSAGADAETAGEPEIGDSTNDAPIAMTVITDDDCIYCDTSRVIAVTKDKFFMSSKVTEVQYDSAEGKALISEFGLKSIPAYVFGPNLAKATNFNLVKDAFITKDGKYLLNPASGVGVKLIEMPEVDDDAVLGSSSAKITIIEFADYECPYCGKYSTETFPQIKAKYIDTGKVRYVFRDFPLSFHQDAQKAAEAAEYAGDQGKYWEMHETLFSNQKNLDVPSLKGYAKDLGLDTSKFDSCLDNGDSASEVKADFQDGVEYGVSGTPAFFVDDMILSGALPFSVFDGILTEMLG